MRRQLHSPEGSTIRELTAKEVREFAEEGDVEALTELAKARYSKASTDTEKLKIIAEVLGLT